VVKVINEGEVLSEEDQIKIFEAFRRGRTLRIFQVLGWGLGFQKGLWIFTTAKYFILRIKTIIFSLLIFQFKILSAF
jgi:signal transduction histidine kinase